MSSRVPLLPLLFLLLAHAGGAEESGSDLWASLKNREAAYLDRGSEDKFANDKPSEFVSSLAARAAKLATADAAYIDEREATTSFATEAADQPAEWLTAITAKANELAAADGSFVDNKQAAASKAKEEAKKVVDPTKGMNADEKKEYYKKALQEAKAAQKTAAANLLRAVKEADSADKAAAKKVETASKKRAAAEAAEAEAAETISQAKRAALTRAAAEAEADAAKATVDAFSLLADA